MVQSLCFCRWCSPKCRLAVNDDDNSNRSKATHKNTRNKEAANLWVQSDPKVMEQSLTISPWARTEDGQVRTSQKKKQVNQANRKRLEDGKDKSHLASGFFFFFNLLWLWGKLPNLWVCVHIYKWGSYPVLLWGSMKQPVKVLSPAPISWLVIKGSKTLSGRENNVVWGGTKWFAKPNIPLYFFPMLLLTYRVCLK